MSKVLITGGNGFIGSSITEYFCNRGSDLICLVRKSSDIRYIKNLNVKLVYADLRDKDSLYKNIDSKAGFVIHNAGMATDWGKYKDFYEANVKGSLNLVQVCVEKGIKNFIITSSNSVYGEENSIIVKNENAPLNSHYKYFMDNIFPSSLNYYRDTKRMAKEKIIEFAVKNSVNVTFIEPVWVYGEREFNTGFYEYLKTVKTGIPFLMGSNKNFFHVVYVKDLARAYYMAYKKNLTGVNSIIIGNPKAMKMDEIYRVFCQELGKKKPQNIPKYITYPLGFILEFLYTLFKVKKPPLLTRGRVNMFYDNIEYSTEKAKELLGFVSEYPLAEGVKKTIKWYRDNGFL